MIYRFCRKFSQIRSYVDFIVKYDSGMLHVRRDRGQFWSCNFILLFIGTSCSRVYWDTLSKVFFFNLYKHFACLSLSVFLLFLKNVKTAQTYHGNLQDPRKIWPGKNFINRLSFIGKRWIKSLNY